jgi:UDP-glucose:glycoprotein glucosyltransferase
VGHFGRRDILLRPELREEIVKIEFPQESPRNATHINVRSGAYGALAENRLPFWLLRHLASPEFRAWVASAALKFAFEYEFVSYKWPQWLRTEKDQAVAATLARLLFADLFLPEAVRRVIASEPGYIVRGDLAELADIEMRSDIRCGFIPYCNGVGSIAEHHPANQPLWQKTLKGKRFVSSAIAVLDVQRLRESTVGE